MGSPSYPRNQLRSALAAAAICRPFPVGEPSVQPLVTPLPSGPQAPSRRLSSFSALWPRILPRSRSAAPTRAHTSWEKQRAGLTAQQSGHFETWSWCVPRHPPGNGPIVTSPHSETRTPSTVDPRGPDSVPCLLLCSAHSSLPPIRAPAGVPVCCHRTFVRAGLRGLECPKAQLEINAGP